MITLLSFLILSNFQFLFDTEGYGELRKFGGHLRPRSAMGKIEIASEVLEVSGLRLVVFGFENIWMGRDKGLIQLDPQEADYLLGFGFKKKRDGFWYGVYLDHTCYHKIDTLVDRPLYWNKVKLVLSNMDLREKFSKGGLLYRFEWGFFLRSDKISWLTVGNPNQWDLLLKIHYTFPFGNRFKPFFNANFYSGLTLDYNFTPEIELNFGVLATGLKNEGMLFFGIRPLDKKTYREAEGVPYAGLKIKF